MENVSAVTQKGGPQMIRDFIDVCDALSKDSQVVRRQTAAERHASSIVQGLAKEKSLLNAHFNAIRLDAAPKLTVEMSSRGVRANRVTFNKLRHARVFAKDWDGTWKVLDHMKSANIAMNAVTCSILLKSLPAHTPQRHIKRVFDLVLEPEVDDTFLSAAVEACNRLQHMKPLSQLFTNCLPCLRSSPRPSLEP